MENERIIFLRSLSTEAKAKMIRFQIKLDETSFKALRSLAEQECRNPHSQAELIIRRELEQHGLLAASSNQSGISELSVKLIPSEDLLNEVQEMNHQQLSRIADALERLSRGGETCQECPLVQGMEKLI